MISPGLKVGDYVIRDELGRGGFASVYHAIDQRTGEEVAIKFLFPKVMHSAGARQVFVDEMINQARLSVNPNIVRVIKSVKYSDRQGDHLGMVMEYVDGNPLTLLIERNGLLSDFYAIPIFLQILNGLNFAHKNSMLHRDIKPGNIIVRKDGLTKIMDFGLSKIIQGTQALRDTLRAASPDFTAPERLEKGDIDARTDIYSVGAALYMALTGRPPYDIDPEDWDDALKKHRSGIFPGIRDFYPRHPEELDRIVRKALEPERSRRYERCEGMIADLRALFLRTPLPAVVRPDILAVQATTKKIFDLGEATRDRPRDFATVRPPAPERPPTVTASSKITPPPPAPRGAPVTPALPNLPVPPRPGQTAQASLPEPRTWPKTAMLSVVVIAALIAAVYIVTDQVAISVDGSHSLRTAALAVDPSPETRYRQEYDRALGYFRIGEFEKALAAVQAAMGFRSTPEAVNLKGQIEGRSRQEREAYDQAAVHLQNGEFEQALASVQIALNIRSSPRAVDLKRQIDDRIGQEREESAYKRAALKDTVNGYQEYLSAYPNGKHVDKVRERLLEIQ